MTTAEAMAARRPSPPRGGGGVRGTRAASRNRPRAPTRWPWRGGLRRRPSHLPLPDSEVLRAGGRGPSSPPQARRAGAPLRRLRAPPRRGEDGAGGKHRSRARRRAGESAARGHGSGSGLLLSPCVLSLPSRPASLRDGERRPVPRGAAALGRAAEWKEEGGEGQS